jgi:hypothetical protein
MLAITARVICHTAEGGHQEVNDDPGTSALSVHLYSVARLMNLLSESVEARKCVNGLFDSFSVCSVVGNEAGC